MALPLRAAGRVIPAATLVSSNLHCLPSQLLVAELFFDVPLNYRDPDGEKIRLFGRAAFKHEKPIVASQPPWSTEMHAGNGLRDLLFGKPWLAYLEGGPGAGNREPQDYPITRLLLGRGYQLLFLDYRGTGMSTPVSAATLQQRGSATAQAEYLRQFRADNIVRDLEAVRRCLTADQPTTRRSWSIMGQSFGGFVSLTYLSNHPDSLREVFLTGGLAPVGHTADEVYRATYRKALERNQAYFRKFPEDSQALRIIGNFLNKQPDGGLPLPAGGLLTFHRVLTFGYAFGFHGGLDNTHAILLRMRTDIDRLGILSRPTLTAVEQFFPLDSMPIYGILHEPIYCYDKGIASRWAAQRVAAEFEQFQWLEQSVISPVAEGQPHHYFSGEMIYPFMFDTYPELMQIKEAANILAEYDDWEPLYDEKQLAENRVPVYAASYINDLYVDYELARETARKVGNIKVFETNTLYHNAIRSRPDEVMAQLFRLRDDSID
ncbi:proline iminopeptidase [Grosmannia clavigera kw1407]|uniref:Proline iminopeptidase n=1 Tax=Grosmannia clavigera (strain kw1407 / UAMH 11150) TaxID=655863 RepID=F0XS34_GROCL|nr:proline iminopeptidase [Grosmannia clavigera kw1407]EFW99614.1 proline iminopeptidase [Grosmannia clavigera kw1407]